MALNESSVVHAGESDPDTRLSTVQMVVASIPSRETCPEKDGRLLLPSDSPTIVGAGSGCSRVGPSTPFPFRELQAGSDGWETEILILNWYGDWKWHELVSC